MKVFLELPDLLEMATADDLLLDRAIALHLVTKVNTVSFTFVQLLKIEAVSASLEALLTPAIHLPIDYQFLFLMLISITNLYI